MVERIEQPQAPGLVGMLCVPAAPSVLAPAVSDQGNLAEAALSRLFEVLSAQRVDQQGDGVRVSEAHEEIERPAVGVRCSLVADQRTQLLEHLVGKARVLFAALKHARRRGGDLRFSGEGEGQDLARHGDVRPALEAMQRVVSEALIFCVDLSLSTAPAFGQAAS